MISGRWLTAIGKFTYALRLSGATAASTKPTRTIANLITDDPHLWIRAALRPGFLDFPTPAGKLGSTS